MKVTTFTVRIELPYDANTAFARLTDLLAVTDVKYSVKAEVTREEPE